MHSCVFVGVAMFHKIDFALHHVEAGPDNQLQINGIKFEEVNQLLNSGSGL